MENPPQQNSLLHNINAALAEFMPLIPAEKRESLILTVGAMCVNCAANGLTGSRIFAGMPIQAKQQLADDLTVLIQRDGEQLTAALRAQA